jgi:hypothetical protein
MKRVFHNIMILVQISMNVMNVLIQIALSLVMISGVTNAKKIVQYVISVRLENFWSLMDTVDIVQIVA